MDYRRSVRFEYYEVTCNNIYEGPNSPDKLFDLTLFIDSANKLSIEQRKVKYYQEHARLDTVEYEDNHDLWFLEFVRLRDTNIPNIAKDNQESEPIQLAEDEYIGENACALYDQNLHVIMLQRNIHSLSPSGIEYYLNAIWKNEKEQISLRPICPIELQKSILDASEYRKIEIRLAKLKAPDLRDSVKSKAFKAIIDAMAPLGGNNITLTVSIGRKKDDRLNKQEARELIGDVYKNRDIVSGAKLSLRENPDDFVDVVDLFEAKLHDDVPIFLTKKESVLSTRMKVTMLEVYKNAKGKIMATINRG